MKGQIRLKITEEDFNEIRSLVMAEMPKEGFAFLLAGAHTGKDGTDIIARRVIRLPDTEYRERKNCHLDISPRAINGLIALCQANRLGVILCHSHRRGIRYSPSDDYGESRIANTLFEFLPDVPVGSLLLEEAGGINARLWRPDGTCLPISSVSIIGRSIHEIRVGVRERRKTRNSNGIYDRQVLAFGKEGQAKLSKAKVAIAGVGGTGSAVAEQITRLGVRDLVLIDPDVSEPSNLTRMHETKYSDVYPRSRKSSMAKVDIVAKRLKGISPHIIIQPCNMSVVKTEAASLLLDRDLIFSCTDDHWGRAVLNQVAHQYLIPVINVGVRIDAPYGQITGAAADMHVIRPGKPCLWCYGFLTPEKIRSQSLPPDMRESLAREGYVEGLDGPAPSVVSLTTTISGFAVTQFLQLMTDFMGEKGDVSLLKYHVLDGTVTRGSAQIDGDCCCLTFKGFGDLKPLFTT